MLIHIDLCVEGAAGKTQPVEAQLVSPRVYRIVRSPGFVEGVAAGDLIKLCAHNPGQFDMVEHGGNLAVKIADMAGIGEKLPAMDSILAKVGGRRDGNLEQVAVWSIPVKSGFEHIEAAISEACELLVQPEWWYGNVYDENDNPLNWWL